MLKKMIGCVLMLLGTAVGAGMLALPIATAHANWQTTLAMMVGSWFIMTAGAFALLEVNLWFPKGANFISMAGKTLGKHAKLLTWFLYLLLFYSLLCAYLSGSSDISHALLHSAHIDLPRWATTLFALLILSLIVSKGVGTIDIVNRGLMSIKLVAYIILILVIAPHITLPHLTSGTYSYTTSSLMVIVTSFGFATIIPTLRDYLHGNSGQLKKVIIAGSLLPMVIYLIWIVLTQGLIARPALIHMASSSGPNSLLMHSISVLLNKGILGAVAKIFISICAVTSFLGVSIGLVDFIADGFQWEKGVKVYLTAFLPPLIIVLLAPGIFIRALSYAGFCCVFLLILLPMLMLYRGRYVQKIKGEVILPGRKILIIVCAVIAVLLMILQWVNV